MKQSNLIIALLLLIIVTLVSVLIFRKPLVVVEEFDDSALRLELEREKLKVERWKEEAERLQVIATKALAAEDSLSKLPRIIHKHYDNIYKIIPDGTNAELDSLIRANW